MGIKRMDFIGYLFDWVDYYGYLYFGVIMYFWWGCFFPFSGLILSGWCSVKGKNIKTGTCDYMVVRPGGLAW